MLYFRVCCCCCCDCDGVVEEDEEEGEDEDKGGDGDDVDVVAIALGTDTGTVEVYSGDGCCSPSFSLCASVLDLSLKIEPLCKLALLLLSRSGLFD